MSCRFELEATEKNNLKRIGDSIERFKDQILLMSLTREQTNQIFKLFTHVVDTYTDAIKSVISSSESKLIQSVEEFDFRIKRTLLDHDSAYKRQKKFENNRLYVHPEEKAIGFKWMQIVNETSGKIERKYKQNTFQFIAPSATVKALFSDPHFEKMYFESETKSGHLCVEGVYRDYCCGTNFRKNQFLQENPNALVFQLYTDDFEPCDALKSKAGRHKICAFYMIIRNMPKKLQSRLSNIFLVALADSTDLKNDSASIDNILEVIIADFRMMETVGINIDGTIIKGCLFTMSFDNLGANTCFKLVQSFSANYFCRFCECHHDECRVLSREDPSKLRDIESYNKICARILDEQDLTATETKCIRSYCKLNDLPNFHIFANYTVDAMHDILEGAVPYTLHIIFEYCLEKKILKLVELQNMIQSYNYGYLNKRNIPSKLKMKSTNLGQNSTQLYCLITNLPFILYGYRDRLGSIWMLVETLLQLIEIVFSEVLYENDLYRLETVIERHTNFIVQVMKKDLIPKHHHLLHYPRVIKAMGPAIFTCTMRSEAKHQELKSTAQKTKNFINLTKTIAEKHQQLLSLRDNRYCDQIEPGKATESFEASDEYEEYKPCFTNTLVGNEMLIKSLKVNDSIFRTGLLVIFESTFHEINQILQSSNSYWLLCANSFRVVERDSFCNSLILEEDSLKNCALNINQILNMKLFQKVFIQGKIHVVSDTLDLFRLFQA